MSAVGHRVINGLGKLGRKLILVAFGALLTGALLSFFTILQSRFEFIYSVVRQLLGQMGF